MKIVYLDMDGPLADFDKAIGEERNENGDPPEMFKKGFFRNLEVTPYAKMGVSLLLDCEDIDLYIASKPSTKNLYSATEKYEWIDEHFPELLKKVFLTCDKGKLIGDYLIDDDADRWKRKFKGEFIQFYPAAPLTSWYNIVDTLGVCNERILH
jgi:5'(3')-deoxyribonucleotidase